MNAKLLGYSQMKGTSKKTGKPYDGFMFHLAYPEKNVEGEATAQIFVDTSILEKTDTPLKVNGTYEFEYDVSFNGYQRLSAVTLCE